MQMKHIGRGKFSAFDEAGNRLGPIGSREDVEAWMAGEQTAVEMPPASPQEPSGGIDVKAYERSLRAARKASSAPAYAAVRAAVADLYEGAVLERVMRRIEAVLKHPYRRNR